MMSQDSIPAIMEIAVSNRPPDGDLSCFALEFSQPLLASVRSFISIHQVAPATAQCATVAANAAARVVHSYSPGGAGMNSIIPHAFINDLDLD